MDEKYIPFMDGREEIPDYAMIPAGDTARSAENVAEDGAVEMNERASAVAAPGAAGSITAHVQESAVMPQAAAAGTANLPPAAAASAARPAGALHTAAGAADTPAADTDAAVRLIPAEDDLRITRIKLSGVSDINVPNIRIEEDVLVPDTQPDLEKTVSVTASPEVTNYESYAADGTPMLRINGNFTISALYIPAGSRELVAITSKVPFKREFHVTEQLSAGAEINVSGSLQSSRVINERKIRVTAGASIRVHEHSEKEIELLEGVRDDSLLLRKEKICFTDVAQRREDTTDIRERIRLKDSYPDPHAILRYDADVVENHRQISRGKAVIEASVYYGILYMPETSGEDAPLPVYLRGHTDFTQFLRLQDAGSDEVSGSTVSFSMQNCSITLHDPNAAGDEAGAENEVYEEDEDSAPYFMLSASISTGIQVCRNIEREVVTDMYHRTRELEFSTAPYEVSEMCGGTSADISVRETVSIPENSGSAGEVPYVSVIPGGINVTAGQDRCTVEGVLNASVIYIDEAGGGMSCFDQQIPFHAVIDMPGTCAESRVECVPAMKDIWFDRMNSHQIDVSCSMSVRVSAWNVTKHAFIDKVCYVESGAPAQKRPGIVVYMTRPGDTQWSVSKKFRITGAALREVNGIEAGDELIPGMRLLIV